MSEEYIKKLSKEYSDGTVNPYGFSEETLADLQKERIDEALSVIRFLLRDYCIVPKSEVVDWVNTLENFMPNTQSATMMKIGAKRLFGKELF